MKIETFVLGLLSNNTYLAINEEKKTCFLVDPSTPSEKVADYIIERSLKLEAILLTHGHFDHIGGVNYFKQKFGTKVYMHADDIEFIDNPLKIGRKFDKFEVDCIIDGDCEIELCGQNVRVVSTPGHSKGGVCYIADDVIFCGDTIFRGSYGRTDLRGGDINELAESINKILSLEGNYILLSGHGQATTSDFERSYNPIFGDAY